MVIVLVLVVALPSRNWNPRRAKLQTASLNRMIHVSPHHDVFWHHSIWFFPHLDIYPQGLKDRFSTMAPGHKCQSSGTGGGSAVQLTHLHSRSHTFWVYLPIFTYLPAFLLFTDKDRIYGQLYIIIYNIYLYNSFRYLIFRFISYSCLHTLLRLRFLESNGQWVQGSQRGGSAIGGWISQGV